MVKVFNDNKFVFEQSFRGENIRIEPGKFIEMPWDDAIQFKSMYFPPKYDGSGVQKPESYKMIRIEGSPQHETAAMKVCSCCGDKFLTDAELESHINKNHLDQMQDQEVAEKRRKS